MRWYRWPAPSWWRLELKKDESKRMDIDDFLETVRRYTDATTITKRMVAELIFPFRSEDRSPAFTTLKSRTALPTSAS